jgi:hypothetical protein
MAAGALIACGATLAVAAPANAGVRIGVGIGVPVVPAYGASPCYGYDSPYCGYPAYYGPGYVGAYWGGRGYCCGYGARGYWGHVGWRPAVHVGVGRGFGHVGFGGARRL